MKNRCWWLILLINSTLAALLFVACKGISVDKSLTPLPTTTHPGMRETSVITGEPVISQTAILTLTKSIPTLPPAPSRTATLTPVPTLIELEAQTLIQKLLVDNGDCELPCVWGLTPGKTTWSEAQQFLQSFAEFRGKGDGNYLSGTVVGYEFQIRGLKAKSNIEVVISNYIVEGFYLSPPGSQTRYRLGQLLSRYGQPQEVYIGTGHNTPGDFIPFDLIIYYPEIGLSALFNYQASIRGQNIIVCPNAQPIGPEVNIWEPQDSLTPEEQYPDYFHSPGFPMLTIEDALGLDVKQFSNLYKDENSDRCFTSPIKLWE